MAMGMRDFVMPDLIRHPCLERGDAPPWIAGQAHYCPDLSATSSLWLKKRRIETEIYIETQSVPRAHLAARLCTGWLRRAAQP
jgi:hypothetical protein